MTKPNTLDQWEAESTNNVKIKPASAFDLLLFQQDERILALIELVRKKDELLKDIFECFEDDHKKTCAGISNLKECNCGFTWIKNTIALTEQLGRGEGRRD